MNIRRLFRLINDLSHPNESKRRFAAEALAEGDERALYPLIKALRDENAGVQDAAMRSLISIGGDVTAYMVLPLLREDSLMRNTALIILKEIGAASIPLLQPLLMDKDDDVRKFAIDLICETRQCSFLEELASVFEKDTNPNVRASAAKALGILNYKEALPALINALNDEEWVCFSVLESLASMRDESSIEPVARLLESPSDAVRYAAIEALGVIGSPIATDALMSRLMSTEGFERTAVIKSLVMSGVTPSMPVIFEGLMEMFENGDWNERLIALKGITALKEERAIPAVVDIAGSLDPSEPESEDIIFAVKDCLKSFDCTGALVDVLDSPSIKFRGKVIAIDVIGDLKCKKAVPHLIKLLERDIRDIRRTSIRSLGEMQSDEARDAIIDAVADYDGHIRRVAVSALGRMGAKEAYNPIMNLLYVEKYTDVIEEAVKALLMLDSEKFLSSLNNFDSRIKEMVNWIQEM